MTTLNKAAYARHRGVDRAHITRLGAAGRLVLTADGLVEVEASDRLIEATGGLRPDVAEREAQKRAAGAKKTAPEGGDASQTEKIAPRHTAQTGGGLEAEKIGNSLQASRAVKEKYAALRAKAEYETLIGNLIPREDVDAAMRFIGGAVRAALEVFPDQTAPLVAPVTDLAEIQEILVQACRDTLNNIGDAMNRQTAELNKEAA